MQREEEALRLEIEHENLTRKKCKDKDCYFYHDTSQVAQVLNQVREVPVPYLEIQAIINGYSITALIDLGSYRNFINPATVKELGLRQDNKTYLYRVIGADGNALNETGLVTGETALITYQIQDKIFIGTFDILPIGSHVLIFGILQLREYNPYIDQTKGTITFGLGAPAYGISVIQIRVEEIPTDY